MKLVLFGVVVVVSLGYALGYVWVERQINKIAGPED